MPNELNDRGSGSTPEINPRAIVSIRVERLFGTRTYVIPSADHDPSSLSQILILYGDNGSGKTTLLRLIYSLLSPRRTGGFKTFIAQTPFSSLSVGFADGTQISAVREGDRVTGGFTLALSLPTGERYSIDMPAGPDNLVHLPPTDEAAYAEFQKHVYDLQVALYYLSDDRRVQLSHSMEEDEPEREMLAMLSAEQVQRYLGRAGRPSEAAPFELDRALKAFNQWTRQQALRASNRGDANANTIYTDVIKRIVALPSSENGHLSPEILPLRQTLVELAVRNESFSALGFTPPLAISELLETLDRAPAATQPIISSVLETYINGIKARLDALEELRDLVATFISNLNDLYANKQVSFVLRHGLTIQAENGALLSPEHLSSGEKQLLLLLCNAMVARDQTSIFVIDEPEISLNVKWQRKLVRTLLDCIAGSAVQFVLATHSIELLSRYTAHVEKLEPAASLSLV